MKKVKSFTLIELVVVMMILGIIVTIVTINVYRAKSQGTYHKITSDMETIASAAEQFKDKYGEYPPNINQLKGEFLTSIPTPPCSGAFTYEYNILYPTGHWEGTSKFKYPNNDPWVPFTRVALQKKTNDDDVTITYYKCLLPNAHGECSCNDVICDSAVAGSPLWICDSWGGSSFCRGYNTIENAPKNLSCNELDSILATPKCYPSSGQCSAT